MCGVMWHPDGAVRNELGSVFAKHVHHFWPVSSDKRRVNSIFYQAPSHVSHTLNVINIWCAVSMPRAAWEYRPRISRYCLLVVEQFACPSDGWSPSDASKSFLLCGKTQCAFLFFIGRPVCLIEAFKFSPNALRRRGKARRVNYDHGKEWTTFKPPRKEWIYQRLRKSCTWCGWWERRQLYRGCFSSCNEAPESKRQKQKPARRMVWWGSDPLELNEPAIHHTH